MDSDHDEMPSLGPNKTRDALVQESGWATPPSKSHASFTDIAEGGATDSESIFERKAALINQYMVSTNNSAGPLLTGPKGNR